MELVSVILLGLIFIILFIIIFFYISYKGTEEYKQKKYYLGKYNNSKNILDNIIKDIKKRESKIQESDKEMQYKKRMFLFNKWDVSYLKSFDGIGRGTSNLLKSNDYENLSDFSVSYNTYLKKWIVPNNIYSRLNLINGLGPNKISTIVSAVGDYLTYIDYALQNNLDFNGKDKIERYYHENNKKLQNEISLLRNKIPAVKKEIFHYQEKLNKFNNISFTTYLFKNNNFRYYE